MCYFCFVCVCVRVFTVCQKGACPLSHLAACGFFHDLLNEGKNTPSCPQENSPGAETSGFLVFSLTLCAAQSFSLLLIVLHQTRRCSRTHFKQPAVFAFFPFTTPIRICLSFYFFFKPARGAQAWKHAPWTWSSALTVFLSKIFCTHVPA